MKWEHEVWKLTHTSAHETALATQQQGHEADMQENAPQPTGSTQ